MNVCTKCCDFGAERGICNGCRAPEHSCHCLPSSQHPARTVRERGDMPHEVHAMADRISKGLSPL